MEQTVFTTGGSNDAEIATPFLKNVKNQSIYHTIKCFFIHLLELTFVKVHKAVSFSFINYNIKFSFITYKGTDISTCRVITNTVI